MRIVLVMAALTAAFGQEIMPARATAEDYKARAVVGGLTLAADFQGRTVPAPEAAFITKDYLVIELAVFGGAFEFRTNRYSLRVNGKTPLLAQTPGMVAGSLQFGNWENQRSMTAEGSMGNAGVILGRQNTPRFPGDRRVPTPPPGTPSKPVVEKEMKPWEWVERLAWTDGPGKGPAAGLLYFPFSGNLTKIKTLELIYAGEDGKATLSLRGSGGSPAK